MKSASHFIQSQFQVDAIQNHFHQLHQHYGSITAINLLNNNGNEKTLHDMYELYMAFSTEDAARYIAFDFHAICSGNKFENIDSQLVRDITTQLDSYGLFVENKQTGTLELQKGVMRTNCVDCLDRTNVAQSSIAKHMLLRQLTLIMHIDTAQKLSEVLPKSGIATFMSIWADHADQMSYRYTNTTALKTDYTRKGKRELKGLISDGVISLKRAVVSIKTNNYAIPQETLEVLLGKKQYANDDVWPKYTLPTK